jgi:hypothetical protein
VSHTPGPPQIPEPSSQQPETQSELWLQDAQINAPASEGRVDVPELLLAPSMAPEVPLLEEGAPGPVELPVEEGAPGPVELPVEPWAPDEREPPDVVAAPVAPEVPLAVNEVLFTPGDVPDELPAEVWTSPIKGAARKHEESTKAARATRWPAAVLLSA